MLEELSALAHAHLVLMEDEDVDTPRFRRLETIRAYALEALAASGEGDAVRTRHLHYYLAVAEEAVAELAGPRQAAWLQRVDRDLDNLRAVVEARARLGAEAWEAAVAVGQQMAAAEAIALAQATKPPQGVHSDSTPLSENCRENSGGSA